MFLHQNSHFNTMKLNKIWPLRKDCMYRSVYVGSTENEEMQNFKVHGPKSGIKLQETNKGCGLLSKLTSKKKCLNFLSHCAFSASVLNLISALSKFFAKNKRSQLFCPLYWKTVPSYFYD